MRSDRRFDGRRESSGDSTLSSVPPVVAGLQFFGNLSSSRTSVISTAVATYGDDSGFARDATQAVGPSRPAYTAADPNFGGRPSMTGDNIAKTVVAVPFAPSSGNACTLCAVFRSAVGATNQHVISFGTVANSVRIYTDALGTALNAEFNNILNVATTRQVAIATATSYRIIATFDATTGATAARTLFVNGADTSSLVSVLAADGGPLASAAFGVFSYGSAGVGFGAHTITDSLIYDTALSAAQIALTDAWLKRRNGL
jgi:hypothetical protein